MAGPPEESYKYDLLFLSSDEDKLWTEENLVKPMDERDYATCLPHRDFTPGMPKLNQLHEALKDSLRTVLVITPEFLEDWKFKQALDPTLIDEGRLIPLIYQKCNALPEALSKVILLEYSEQGDPCLLLDRIAAVVEQRKKSDSSTYHQPRPPSVHDVVVYGRATSRRRFTQVGGWSVDAFFNDVDGYLQRLDRKEGRPFINIETDICEYIIPEHLVKPALSHWSAEYAKSRIVLSKLSCYRRSTKIVMVALNALNELIVNDPIEGKTANRIYDFEKILRAEVQPTALHAQATKEQRLRLTTYCNLLHCIILHHARGNLKTVFSQEDLTKLETIRRGLEEDYEDNNPPRLSCALICTINALKCLTGPQEKFRKTCQALANLLKEVDCIIKSPSTVNPDCRSLFSKIEKAGTFDISVAAAYLLPKITTARALFCLRAMLDYRIHKCIQKSQSSSLRLQWHKHKKGAQWIILYQTARILVRVLQDKKCPKELRTVAATGNPLEDSPVYQSYRPSDERLLCLASFWTNHNLKKIPGYQTAQPLINKECRELVYSDIPDVAYTVSRHLLVKGNCLEVEKLVTEVQPKRIQSLHSTKGLELEQRDPIHTCRNSVVYHGTMSGNHHVVVKVPRIQRLDSLQCTERTDPVKRIRNETLILKHLQQENIMPIYGYVLAIPPVHYITEFMHYGNLQQHLRNNRRFMWPAQHLLSIATDILKALTFLESWSVVHRNVRARKVLLGQSGSRMTIKLAGFELAREVEQNPSHYHFNMYKGTHEEELPLRWLAVESLAYSLYSVKSDIWMFAVLLYEIFTMGCVPWQEFAARPFDEVLQNIVHRNLRMKRPPCIPNAVFQVILKCMNVEDRSRPSYATLAEELGRLHERYQETSDVIYGEQLTAPPTINESIDVTYTSPIPTIHAPGSVSVSAAGVAEIEEEVYDDVPTISATGGVWETEDIYEDANFVGSESEKVFSAENVYEDVDEQDMMLVSSVAAADQPRAQDKNMYEETTNYGERKARALKDLKREMKNENSTLRMVDLRQSKKDGTMTVVTEGTAMGTLENHLIGKKDTDPTQYALPIAIALQAMHNKGFVHSDLRLGHVFLNASLHGTHDVQIKLGRLSRVKELQLGAYDTDLSESMFHDTDGCPNDSIRWAPAEVIESGTYSFASDVYSLGVVFWQMYMACHVPRQGAHVRLIPYQRLRNEEVLRSLEGSHFLQKPPGCPDWMYTVMKKCWAYQLLERPTVQDVIEVLNHSDHGRRLLGTWSKTCDPPDISGIYNDIPEGNSMDSVLSDRSQMAHKRGSIYNNVQGRLPGDLMTELAEKLQLQTSPHVTTPVPPQVHESEYAYTYDEGIYHYEPFDEEPYEIGDFDAENNEDRPSLVMLSAAGSTQVTVVRSYNPQDHLKLAVGDVLTRLEPLGIESSGWWRGSTAQGRGIFLAAHVKFFDEDKDVVDPDVQIALNLHLQAKVILDYTPEDELRIEAGEVVTVEETSDDDLAWVKVRSNHGEGYVPSSCLARTNATTPSLTKRNIDSDTEDLYEDIDEEDVYDEVSSAQGLPGAPSQAPSTSDHDFKVNMKTKKTDGNSKYRLMVSMADPGQVRVKYTKNGQVKTSMDQCLEADVADGMTEEDRDHYHPLAFGWTIMKMKKDRDTTFVDWPSSAAAPNFPAAVDLGHIIYGPKIANGEEEGRLLLVCMSSSYGKKVVKHEWYKGGDLLCEGVDLCLLYATDPGEYRCHIISCQDDQEMAKSTVKVVRTCRVPDDYLIAPSALRVIEDPIGAGTCGTVFKAMLRGYTTVAAKKLQGCPLDNFGMNNEIEILRKLHHPNIVSFFGVCFRESVFIVTEFVNGYDLKTAITERIEFPPGCQGYIAYQLCQALDYVHHSMILHQDVKPSNVLVDAKTYVTKLSDFGLGYVKRASRTSSLHDGGARRGTIHYKHSESLHQSAASQPQPASDVYGFGCILYELYSGEEVWKGLEELNVMFKVANNEYPSFDHLTGHGEVHNVLSLCFTDADKRATMAELLPKVRKLVGRNYNVD